MKVFLNGELARVLCPSRRVTKAYGSRNCTKHNCRCDYIDNPPGGEVAKSPEGPNLLWTPTIEHEIEVWQATGIFPFFEINLQSYGHFRDLSSVDLRLVHHLSSMYRDMQPANLGNCTLWVERIPRYESDCWTLAF
jgi:hypothetical protein